MKAMGYIWTTIAIGIYNALLNGWAVQKLWGWFVVPTFSVAALTMPAAIGLSMLVVYLTHRISTKTDDREYGEIMFTAFFTGTFKPIMTVGVAWIVSLFM